MNSNVYCLPQKLGWMTCTEKSTNRLEEQARYVNKRSPHPFHGVDFNAPPNDEASHRMDIKYPQMAQARSRVCKHMALQCIYKSTYDAEFTPGSPTAPKTDKKGTPANDGDRGYHEWRQLLAATTVPGYASWQPFQRTPALAVVGYGRALPPIRRPKHDPAHERARWDKIRALDQENALSYGYRMQIPRYVGHRFKVEHVDTPLEKDVTYSNTTLMSTAQDDYSPLKINSHPTAEDNSYASYHPCPRKLPIECYQHRPHHRNAGSDCQYCYGTEMTCTVDIPVEPAICAIPEPDPESCTTDEPPLRAL